MTVIYGEENIDDDTLPTHETATLVKSRDIPSTFDQEYTGTNAGVLKSVYGTTMTIGPVGLDTKNWYVSYSDLTIEQCAKLLPGINKTKPIAITNLTPANALGSAVTTAGAEKGAACASTITSKRTAMAGGMCGSSGILTVYYSPAKQAFGTCTAQ